MCVNVYFSSKIWMQIGQLIVAAMYAHWTINCGSNAPILSEWLFASEYFCSIIIVDIFPQGTARSFLYYYYTWQIKGGDYNKINKVPNQQHFLRL